MKVLKFGGTSVGSSKSIQSVIEIVKSNSPSTKQIVVVSAFSGVTNLLLEGIQAILNKENTIDEISAKIVDLHLVVINELIEDEKAKNKIFKYLHAELDSLKQLYKGISLIGELTAKTEAKIVCFGELLSSFIVGEAMVSAGLNVERKDSRQLIIANQNYTNAPVDFKITIKNIQD